MGSNMNRYERSAFHAVLRSRFRSLNDGHEIVCERRHAARARRPVGRVQAVVGVRNARGTPRTPVAGREKCLRTWGRGIGGLAWAKIFGAENITLVLVMISTPVSQVFVVGERSMLRAPSAYNVTKVRGLVVKKPRGARLLVMVVVKCVLCCGVFGAVVLFKALLGDPIEGQRGYRAIKARHGNSPRARGTAPAGELVPLDPDHACHRTWPLVSCVVVLGPLVS